MDTRYAPVRGGRFNVQLVGVGASNVGNLTANATTTFFIAVPAGKYYISKLSLVCNTVGADADGTILGTFKKYDGVANSGVALNTATDLETLVTKETRDVTVLASLTPAQRILNTANGDSLYVEVVNNSAAINTQPTNLCFAAELMALK